MLRHEHFSLRISLAVASLCVAWAIALDADAPRGWHLAGSKPAYYETGIDEAQAYQGHASAYLKSKAPHAEGFGTLMQSISARQYLGSKVRLSGLVKSEEVTGWGGLWMRVDRFNTMLSIDNMQNRAIKGTTGWQRYDVVLDVPKDATRIAFGILLNGSGEVWLNSARLELVGLDVPTTTVNEDKLPEKPVNLEFAE